MRRISIACLTAACIAAPVTQAGSLDNVIEPAMVMKLDFGGSQKTDFAMGLRLNYSTSIRQGLAGLSANPDTALEALDTRIGSNLFTGPSVMGFDFNNDGFHKASLMGRTLVTRYVVRQDEEGGGEEAVEEGSEAPAEDAAWYDYEQWGYVGWGLAAAGAVGVYLLVDDDDEEPAAAGGGGGGGGGDGECGPGEIPNPLPIGPPCV